jgi:diaminohydroxyphosphoribosylaminopyrimidine deaminase/5-amino-6-(5-phosphoribosylamino)uracil reductase
MIAMADTDRALMMRALELARRGAGLTSPNPMVGAVIFRDGRIVGEGYYLYDRIKHAEIHALEMAGPLARGATLYCTLEPCSHYGRTPPCTDRLIEAGIARAVVAIKDPDSRVNGRGLEQLRAAGVEINVGLCEDEATRLNESYLKYSVTGTPFVHALIRKSHRASVSHWIPPKQLRELAKEYDAILMGSHSQASRSIIEACLNGDRHRPLVVITTAGDVEKGITDARVESSEVEIILIEQRRLGADLLAALRKREGLPITSILILPGALDAGDSHWLEMVDKVTSIED